MIDAKWVIGIIVTIVASIFGYFLQSMKNEYDKKIKKVEVENEKQASTLVDLKVELAEKYTLKTDFLRVTGQIESKLDKIFEILTKMAGKESKG